MSDLFKIKDVVVIDHFDVAGNAWHSEDYARRSNREIAMISVVGRAMLDKGYVYTTIGNIAKMPEPDLLILRDLFDRYLAEVEPKFLALEGPFTYGTGKVIETADGHTFDEPLKASYHVLDGLLSALFKSEGFSDKAKRLICNASEHLDASDLLMRSEFTDYRFRTRLKDFYDRTSDAAPYGVLPGQIETFAKMLHAGFMATLNPVNAKVRPPAKKAPYPKKAAA